MEWNKELNIDVAKHVIENCYMLAKKKRHIVHTYEKGPTGEIIPIPVGPKSEDTDWDHIIRFCESAGVQTSILHGQELSDEDKDKGHD
jgi:hypothetical protein